MLKPVQKPPVYRQIGQMAARMHFLIQREAASLNHHRSAQPVPAHVGAQARPIYDDQQLRQAREPMPCERAIQRDAFLMQMDVTQQPIHAFDAVA